MDDDDIRDFLIEHPDYFQRNQDLLGLLQVPHASGAAVSLVERQVSVLRERNVDLRHRLRELGATAKDNDQLFSATRALVLALLDARDLAGLQTALVNVLRENFDTEYAALLLFADQAASDGPCPVVTPADARSTLKTLLGTGDTGCGALRADEFAFLFSGARVMGSAAVAVVKHGGEERAVLAVGSSDATHYDSTMGTLFLEFAAEVLGRVLHTLDSA